MRRHFWCLCVLAGAALKPPRRHIAAVRPRARAPVAKASILNVLGLGRSRRRGVAVAKGIILYTALRLRFGNIVVLRLFVLDDIMKLDMIEKKWLRAVGLTTSLAIYIGSFCKPLPK